MRAENVVIVGAGLAGLACARALHEAGRPYRVLEASDAVGGRVRTDEVEGFLLDRGFQVFLTAYPEARRVLDYDALELRPLYAGALIRTGDSFHRIADPRRHPSDALATARASIGTFADKLRVLNLRRQVTTPDPEALLQRPEITTREALAERYGFSERIIAQFFEPFMGGVFLDTSLAASSRAFELYLRAFATGDAAVPAGGMQRIPEQLAGALPPEAFQFHAAVRAVEPGGVIMESNGERVDAAAVVLATDGADAAQLLGEGMLEPPRFVGTTCLYYEAPAAPHQDGVLVLDGERTGPVNELVVMSNVSERYAPAERSLISATVVGLPEEEGLDERVRAQMRDWYGGMVDSWRLLRIYRIDRALPAQRPPALSPPRRSSKLAEGLYVCGDHRADASINGALESGRLAAEALLEHV